MLWVFKDQASYLKFNIHINPPFFEPGQSRPRYSNAARNLQVKNLISSIEFAPSDPKSLFGSNEFDWNIILRVEINSAVQAATGPMLGISEHYSVRNSVHSVPANNTVSARVLRIIGNGHLVIIFIICSNPSRTHWVTSRVIEWKAGRTRILVRVILFQRMFPHFVPRRHRATLCQFLLPGPKSYTWTVMSRVVLLIKLVNSIWWKPWH